MLVHSSMPGHCQRGRDAQGDSQKSIYTHPHAAGGWCCAHQYHCCRALFCTNHSGRAGEGREEGCLHKGQHGNKRIYGMQTTPGMNTDKMCSRIEEIISWRRAYTQLNFVHCQLKTTAINLLIKARCYTQILQNGAASQLLHMHRLKEKQAPLSRAPQCFHGCWISLFPISSLHSTEHCCQALYSRPRSPLQSARERKERESGRDGGRRENLAFTVRDQQYIMGGQTILLHAVFLTNHYTTKQCTHIL